MSINEEYQNSGLLNKASTIISTRYNKGRKYMNNLSLTFWLLFEEIILERLEKGLQKVVQSTKIIQIE